MEKKQKTLSLLLAVALGTSTAAQAEATWHTPHTPYSGKADPFASATPVDDRPVLTQVPHFTPEPTMVPVLTQQPLEATPTKEPIATAAPTAKPTLTPPFIPERTQTPKPTISFTPHPTATPQPETSKKPIVATPTPSTDEDYTTGYVGTQEEIAFLLLNQDRKANGKAPLTLDPALCAIARLKSSDMKTNRYFAHNSPTYGSPSQMLKSLGYTFQAVGENIAHHATVEKSQAAFMSSDGHRKNILSSSWTKVGIGVVTDAQGFVYVTQLFVR